MAGTAYGSFSVGDANLDNLMLQTAAVERGHCALTLTEMTTTAIPQIAAGSRIEINGTLFKFDANDSIIGSATTGTNYIYITSAGVATWTTTAPTWFDSKQGWYDATGAYRYTPYLIQLDTGAYQKITFDANGKGPLGVTFAWSFKGTTDPSVVSEESVISIQPSPLLPPWNMTVGGGSGYIQIPFSGLYTITLSAYTNNVTYPGEGRIRLNTAITGTLIGMVSCIYPSAAYTMSETGVYTRFLCSGDKLYLSGRSPSGAAQLQVFTTITKVA